MRERRYVKVRWQPQEDISVYELACLIPLIVNLIRLDGWNEIVEKGMDRHFVILPCNRFIRYEPSENEYAIISVHCKLPSDHSGECEGNHP